MAQREPLVLGSNMLLVLKNLRDADSDVLVEGATVTGQVLDANDSPVGGVPNPITFTEVTGSKGLYVGEIPSAAGYSTNDNVTVKVTAVKAGVTRIFTMLATVVEVL